MAATADIFVTVDTPAPQRRVDSAQQVIQWLVDLDLSAQRLELDQGVGLAANHDLLAGIKQVGYGTKTASSV